MGRILIVGLCCIDTVCYVQKYPEEDTDTRVFEQKTTLGGNAANSSTVMAQFLDADFELFASVPANNPQLESLIESHKIKLRPLKRPNASVPVSTAIVNEVKGTRTILHYRGDLPEISAEEFIAEFSDLSEFSWIHFEGRNFDEIHKMIEHCRKIRNSPQETLISLELEKIRPFPWYDRLVPLVDVLFVSKDFAKHLGFDQMETSVELIRQHFKLIDTCIIIPWGEKGVTAQLNSESPLIREPAAPPDQVVDTLAAGDCFIGVALYSLNRRDPLDVCIRRAAKIAGRKCGQRGLLGLIHGSEDL